MVRSIAETVDGLGEGRRLLAAAFGASSAHFKALNEDMLRPIVHLPKHPIRLARFGIPAAAPATLLARRWETPQAGPIRGSPHAFSPLNRPMSSSVGCALIAACHAYGWAVARAARGRSPTPSPRS